MTQPIQREGTWWSKTEDGWLLWNEDSQSWDQQAAGPPPPAPPGNGAPTPPVSSSAASVATAVQQQITTEPASAPATVSPGPNKSGGKTVAIVAAVVVIAAAAVGGYFLLKGDGDAETTAADSQSDDSGNTDGTTGDTGGSKTGGVTKAEFIAQADALCADASQKFGQLTEPATPEEAGPFLTEAIAINEALYADLSALKPPADDNGAAVAAIGGLKALTDQMKTLLASIEAQDAKAIQANYDQLGVVTDEANSAAAAYGLVACAS